MYNFFKIIISTYFVKKYAKDIKHIAQIIVLIIFISLIYDDIFKYMQSNNISDKIAYVLVIKWIIYILSCFTIYRIIRKIFLNTKKDKLSADTAKKINDAVDDKNELDDGLHKSKPVNNTQSKAEQEKIKRIVDEAIDNKDKLKTKKDSIMDKHIKK